MQNWDEVRTAYQVARHGTVSGAAEALGVHHATVIRHIDALEAQLGVKLFQRHARGYTATEAGRDLLQVAQATEDQFNQLTSRIKGKGEGITGELVVTALAEFSRSITPALVDFQALHPGLRVRFLTSARLFRLEYGEAHVAIRAGTAPEQPDNVVQPLFVEHLSLAVAKSYVARHGMPTEDTLGDHWFVGHDDPEMPAPFGAWLHRTVGADRIVFRSEDSGAMVDAIQSGAGVGFVQTSRLANDPDLIEVMPTRPEWDAPLWIVTHVDLHRSPKVQACVAHLRAAAKEWSHL